MKYEYPTPVLLPGKSHGRRSLVGCNPWGLEESDMTEWLPSHFSLSRIGEGNGNPLQCSCLENPRDGGASWAAVYGVAQSQTWLKWLSSSSSSRPRRRRTFHSFLCSSCSWFPSPPWRQLIIANSSVAFHIFFSTDSNLCSLKNSPCFEFVLIRKSDPVFSSSHSLWYG